MKGLGGESGRPALRAVVVQIASVTVMDLGSEKLALEIHNLLLFLGGWPRPVPLRVDDRGVHRLVRQIVEK